MVATATQTVVATEDLQTVMGVEDMEEGGVLVEVQVATRCQILAPA